MYKIRLSFPLIFCLVLVLVISGCKKEDPPVEPEPVETDIQFLGHKGGGNNGYNEVHMENTIPAMMEGIQALDGVEVDIQMSKDGTIWMFHDADLGYNCDNPDDSRSLILLPDSVISGLRLCHESKKDRIYKLQELIDVWNLTPGGFYISFDVKMDFPFDTFDQVGGRYAYMVKLATQLAEVLSVRNHPASQLLMEVDYESFCEELRKYISDIPMYLSSSDDIIPKIERALAEGYDGISCNYNDLSVTAEGIKTAHDSGLSVQLWTPYYYDELLSAFNRNPDFIQSDNIDAKKELNVK